MNNDTSVLFILGAAMVGIVSAAGAFIYQKIQQKNSKHAYNEDVARLNMKVFTLTKEVERIRELQKAQINHSSESTKNKPNRRKLRSTSSLSTDYNSALDNDSSDEFYDLSSEETVTEDSPTDKVLDNELQELDIILDEESVVGAVNVLQKLNELIAEHPKNPELLWRKGKACKILANQSSDDETKKEYIMKGIESCELGIELNPQLGVCHKWLAILIGLRCEFLSIKDKISDSLLFKKHTEIALSLLPKDAFLHHLLGRYNYEIAQLTWLEKILVQTIYAELPLCSIQDALKHFLCAENLSENHWKENRLFIAKCCLADGNTDSAVEWLNKAEYATSIEEEKVHEEVRDLLEKYDKRR